MPLRLTYVVDPRMANTVYRPGWAWIFIIEGLATMFVGIFCWWMVFDWPDTAVSQIDPDHTGETS